MLEIRGADDLDDLVRQVRAHADGKAIEKKLRRGLALATREVKGPMIEAIPAALPQRGGLAAEIQAATRVRTTVKSGRYAGASMWFSARGHDMRTLTGKRLRHPVFGHRSTWVDQTAGVEPAVFLAAFEDQAPEVKAAIVAVCEEIAREVAG